MRKSVLSFLATLFGVLSLSQLLLAQNSKLWLPLIETTPSVAFCEMWVSETSLWINIHGKIDERGLYIYNHVFPSSPLVYHAGGEGKHLIGDKDLAPAMAIVWLEDNTAYQTKCSVGKEFKPELSKIGIFDRATVQVIKENTTTTWYTIACIYHGDDTLTVTGTIINTDTNKKRDFIWHEDTSGWISVVDCADSPVVELQQPEVLTSVNFKTETDNDTVTAKDFSRWLTHLPIIVVSETLQPQNNQDSQDGM